MLKAKRLREDRTSLAELERHLVSKGVSRRIAGSFTRLARESEYDTQTEMFVFRTCHPHLTNPRLEILSQNGIIIFESNRNERQYQTTYSWIPTAAFGIEIYDTLRDMVEERQTY